MRMCKISSTFVRFLNFARIYMHTHTIKYIMKKHIITFLALLLAAPWIFAGTVTPAADIPAYYASLNNKSGSSLMTTLNTVTNRGFSSLGYDGLWNAYPKTDVYPADSVGKAGKLWDMYGGCEFPTNSKRCGSYSGECDCVNREHSIPKSWWGGGKNNMYSDIFHLVPTDGYVNNRRSAYAFGEVANATYQYNGCKLGSPKEVSTTKATIYNATSATCSASPVFEPGAQYKGDFARGYLGMIASYYNSSYSITSGAGSSIFESFTSSHFGLTKYGVVLLLKWHREDPVSQKEIDRNNGIQQTQGNRNPFIDYPYLAEYIWGEHAGETVDMSHLMASSDADFVPGVSNGWRNGVVPPQPGVTKHGVTWSVNGEEMQTDSVAENQKPASLPDEPVSCSSESPVFMGWTTAPISGTQDDAPAVLYKALADFPAVTADVTYYAVFAQLAVSEPSLPTTYVFDADHQDGWTNTATSKGSYWLREQGKSIVSPEIDLAQLNSIVVKMRTYGGTQYDKLDIYEADGQLATMTATSGSTMTEYTWTNNLYIAGISALTFASDYGQGKGIGIQSITINAGSASDIYIRYITTCQQGSEVQLIETDAPARKILVGGQIFILLGEELYNLTGQKVK